MIVVALFLFPVSAQFLNELKQRNYPQRSLRLTKGQLHLFYRLIRPGLTEKITSQKDLNEYQSGGKGASVHCRLAPRP